jgi:hypothetical protein
MVHQSCSCGVASTIERIDSGCASNPMRVLIRLTAPPSVFPDSTPAYNPYYTLS